MYWRDGLEPFLAILGSDLWLFVEMLPKILAGCLIGAFVTLILPRELVARWVGHESGFSGLLIAAFFGFILPGGPITIYPVAGAFLVMGADAGAVVTFIVSWTLIGYTRALVWELPFLRFRLRDLAHRRGAAIADHCRPAGAYRGARRFCSGSQPAMTIAINILLWSVVAGLALVAGSRGRVLLNTACAKAPSNSSGCCRVSASA